MTGKGKGPREAAPEASLESVFEALEKRVEGLAGRLKDLTAENAQLKAALEHERSAGADRSETAARVAHYEAERREVRARIERLVRSLEEAEGASTA